MDYIPPKFYIPILNKRLTKKNCQTGQTASYYKLNSNLGIKIFNFPISFCEGGSYSLLEIETSKANKLAKIEFKNGKEANKRFKNSCKVYKLTYVKCIDNKKYYPAIILEHISGKEVINLSNETKIYIGKIKTSDERVENDLKRALRSKGINHRDLHGGNILTCLKKEKLQAYIIDFASLKFK